MALKKEKQLRKKDDRRYYVVTFRKEHAIYRKFNCIIRSVTVYERLIRYRRRLNFSTPNLLANLLLVEAKHILALAPFCETLRKDSDCRKRVFEITCRFNFFSFYYKRQRAKGYTTFCEKCLYNP